MRVQWFAKMAVVYIGKTKTPLLGKMGRLMITNIWRTGRYERKISRNFVSFAPWSELALYRRKKGGC